MPDWRDEYLSSFKDMELSNPVNMELVQACSQMADRISALEAEKVLLQSRAPGGNAPSTDQQPVATDDPVVAQLRLDLNETMRSKGVAETRLRTAKEQLDHLRTKSTEDSKYIRILEAEQASLKTRLKDRDHELREKRKLLENVQDEMITLNLQLSVAEKERDRAKKDNKELVDRWMKRMGQEAEAMNLANEKSP